VAITLVVLAALTTPAAARTTAPDAPTSASWHGRAITDPGPRPSKVRTSWPPGWSAGPVHRGTGYVRPGGSRRVRDVQRRLTKLGYRPGPVDGLFGPRTEAAARWFQYKHGLASNGRIDRLTLTVLRARSEHRALPRTTAPVNETPASPPPAQPQPSTPAPQPADTGGGAPIAVFLIGVAIALIAGLLAGTLLPRRRTRTTPVVGYVAATDVDGTVATLEARCADRDWTLLRVVHEPGTPGARLVERPGLMDAVREVEAGGASGIVVSRIREISTRLDDLAVLLQWLGAAGAFLATADDDLDTSTEDGQAAAAAVIDVVDWEARERTRFSPTVEPRIAALQDRGVPDATIADILNLGGVPAPGSQAQWAPADVAAASRRAEEAHS
jgi:peptidoglycan hydrolase-like protein with peptidoglycan-binding domain